MVDDCESAPARCHHRQHTSAARPGRRREGRGAGDLDLAHLLVRHLRAALTNAKRRERVVDALGVWCELLLQRVHVHDHLLHLGIRELRDVAPSHDKHLLTQRALHEQVQDARAYVASGAQQHRRVLDFVRGHCAIMTRASGHAQIEPLRLGAPCRFID